MKTKKGSIVKPTTAKKPKEKLSVGELAIKYNTSKEFNGELSKLAKKLNTYKL